MGKLEYTSDNQDSRTAIIASGASISSAVDMQGGTLVAIKLPAALTQPKLGLLVCDTEGGTYLPVYKDDGTRYVLVVAASTVVIPNLLMGYGFKFVKLESLNSSNAAANEGADRTYSLMFEV